MQEDGKRSPMDVKPGDRILFGKYAGTEIKIDDQDYVIMREEEILAVLESGIKRFQRQGIQSKKIRSEDLWLKRSFMASSRARLSCAE